MIHTLPILSLLLYAASTALFAFSVIEPKQFAGRSVCFWARVALWLAVIFQLTFLASLLTSRVDVTTSWPPLAYSLGWVSAAVTIVYLVLDLRKSLGSLGVLVAPSGLMFFLWAGLAFHLDRAPAETPTGPMLWIHVASAVFSYAVLALSFCVAFGVLVHDYTLRRKKLTRAVRLLPALTSLDYLLSQLLVIGYICMIVGVMSGLYFAVRFSVSFLETDPRLVWSSLLLVVYGVVLFLRFSKGMRGRRGALLSIFAYLFTVGSLWSISLSSTTFHHYSAFQLLLPDSK